MSAFACAGLATALVVAAAARVRPTSGRVEAMRAPRRGAARRQRRGVAQHRPSRRTAALVAAAVLLVGLTGGWQIVAMIVLFTIVRRPLRSARARRRRLTELTTAFPDFVDLLVLAVKSGCSLHHALDSTVRFASVPIASAVRTAARRRLDGEPFAHAVESLVDELGDVARPLVSSLALADRYGTPLVPVLDRLADDARAQRRRNAEVAARQLPVRLSFPLVGCTLPSFVLLTIVPLMAGTLSSFRGLEAR